MFHHLRKAFKWIEQPYIMVRQVIRTDQGGEEFVYSSDQSRIYANIQNEEDGGHLSMGRDGSLVYKTILILTKSRIGLGDPVYPDDSELENLEDAIIYYVKAFGQVYRIVLEGGVQDLSNDSLSEPQYVEQNGYVFYRYHATLVRGPWQ